MFMEVCVAAIVGTFALPVYLTIKNYPAWRQRRTLRRARIWPIGQLPEDTIGRLIGTGRSVGRTLSAPLTGRECVCYLVTVGTPEYSSGDQLQGGGEFLREQKAVRFVLEDGSGRALIELEGAELEDGSSRAVIGLDPAELERTNAYESQSGGLRKLTERERAFLADRTVSFGERWRNHLLNGRSSLIFHEEIVEVGETICVAGAGIREGDPDAEPGEGYRTEPPTRLRFTSSPRLRLLITDALLKR